MTYGEVRLAYPVLFVFPDPFRAGIFSLLWPFVPASRAILISNSISSWRHSILLFRFCQGYYKIFFYFIAATIKNRFTEAKNKGWRMSQARIHQCFEKTKTHSTVCEQLNPGFPACFGNTEKFYFTLSRCPDHSGENLPGDEAAAAGRFQKKAKNERKINKMSRKYVQYTCDVHV